MKILNSDFLVDMVESYHKIKHPTTKDIVGIIDNIYDTLILPNLNKRENKNLTLDECEDLASYVIEASDMLCVFILREFSKDIADHNYRVGSEKILKLKSFLSKLLNTTPTTYITNELLRILFISNYLCPIQKASRHRGMVINEEAMRLIKEIQPPLRKRAGGLK